MIKSVSEVNTVLDTREEIPFIRLLTEQEKTHGIGDNVFFVSEAGLTLMEQIFREKALLSGRTILHKILMRRCLSNIASGKWQGAFEKTCKKAQDVADTIFSPTAYRCPVGTELPPYKLWSLECLIDQYFYEGDSQARKKDQKELTLQRLPEELKELAQDPGSGGTCSVARLRVAFEEDEEGFLKLLLEESPTLLPYYWNYFRHMTKTWLKNPSDFDDMLGLVEKTMNCRPCIPLLDFSHFLERAEKVKKAFVGPPQRPSNKKHPMKTLNQDFDQTNLAPLFDGYIHSRFGVITLAKIFHSLQTLFSLTFKNPITLSEKDLMLCEEQLRHAPRTAEEQITILSDILAEYPEALQFYVLRVKTSTQPSVEEILEQIDSLPIIPSQKEVLRSAYTFSHMKPPI